MFCPWPTPTGRTAYEQTPSGRPPPSSSTQNRVPTPSQSESERGWHPLRACARHSRPGQFAPVSCTASLSLACADGGFLPQARVSTMFRVKLPRSQLLVIRVKMPTMGVLKLCLLNAAVRSSRERSLQTGICRAPDMSCMPSARQQARIGGEQT